MNYSDNEDDACWMIPQLISDDDGHRTFLTTGDTDDDDDDSLGALDQLLQESSHRWKQSLLETATTTHTYASAPVAHIQVDEHIVEHMEDLTLASGLLDAPRLLRRPDAASAVSSALQPAKKSATRAVHFVNYGPGVFMGVLTLDTHVISGTGTVRLNDGRVFPHARVERNRLLV